MYLQESCATPSHSKDTSSVSKARNPRENRMAAVQGMNYVAGLLLLVSQNEVPRRWTMVSTAILSSEHA